MHFQFALRTGQLAAVNEQLKACGSVSSEDAMALLDQNTEDFFKYLYYTLATYLKSI